MGPRAVRMCMVEKTSHYALIVCVGFHVAWKGRLRTTTLIFHPHGISETLPNPSPGSQFMEM